MSGLAGVIGGLPLHLLVAGIGRECSAECIALIVDRV